MSSNQVMDTEIDRDRVAIVSPVYILCKKEEKKIVRFVYACLRDCGFESTHENHTHPFFLLQV